MRMFLIGTGVLYATSVLFGQSAYTFSGNAFQFAGAANSEGQTLFGVASIGSQIVTGRPFSATEERHSVQVLGDGTHIESTETNRLYRDEQGRTRIERSGGAVTIMDPVAGFTAELHPGEKTYSKGALLVREGRVMGRGGVPGIAYTVSNADQYKALQEKIRQELAQARTNKTEGNPDVKRLEAQLADAQKATTQSQVNADEIKALAANNQTESAAKEAQLASRQVEWKTLDGSTGAVVLRVGPGDNGSVESLPAQMINGAMAEGTRTTETIPVGKIGNDRVINIVNERWFSSALQMMVKSTSSDPRFGDTTYQLTNIIQTSPDPSLFQIPAEYAPRK